MLSLYRRKSDIENERLPPELYDASSEEGKAIMSSSQPTTPEAAAAEPISPNGVTQALEDAIASGSVPASPVSPVASESWTSMNV